MGSPSAIDTRLGWIRSGMVYAGSNSRIQKSGNGHVQMEFDLKRFWNLESLCEETYAKTVTRTEVGRYGGFESSEILLGLFWYPRLDWRRHIYRCLRTEKVTSPNPTGGTRIDPYLPHHGVRKDESTITKLRVVFNASATYSEGRTLNDYLEKGPKLQKDLLKWLLKFRVYPIAMTADLEKMYRMILVNKDQVDFQRIFWLFSSTEEPIKSYRLLTVTYGTACAPFLAMRTLLQLAQDYEKSFPDTAKVIGENFYLDDLLTGADSVPEARRLVKELIQVLGGFTIRAGNDIRVVSDLPSELKSLELDAEVENKGSILVHPVGLGSSR
ncbi:hypothetical protein AVEN_163246-1 [Araneus ventricosus]|uniref:Reverse transcriptase domain-containing protein n=1 Tax=Araneus ventricosus TaxID=182803 RepID=A0A4Y2L2Y6_ARAVE|nr:hypothetical protein AVEN_163246-1 [Araneus ventricosus]